VDRRRHNGYNTAMRHQVGIRVLRDGLSRWIARVREGDVVVVTDHGKPVAYLAPAAEPPAGESDREFLGRMVREGRILGGAGTPEPAHPFFGPEVDLEGALLADREEEGR
jgi:prevent-host-death family protein